MNCPWLIRSILAVALGFHASVAVADEPRQGASAPRSVTLPETKNIEKSGINTGVAGSILSSRFANSHRDLEQSAKYIDETLAHEPKNEKFVKDGIRINVLIGDIAKAQRYVAMLPKITHKEPLIASLLMLQELDAKHYASAHTLIENASSGGLFGVIKPVLLRWIEVAKNPAMKPVDMQKIVDKSGFFAPFLNYQQALINDVLGHQEAASGFYRLASADAALTPYRVVEALANFYMRQGQWKQAQEVFDSYAKANPDSSLLPDNLLTLGVKRDVPKPLVANSREGLAEIYFTTASILYGEEATEETFLFLRLALYLRPDFPPAQLMLANLYEQINSYQKAIRVYDTIAPGNVFFRRGQVRKALNLEALGKIDEAIALLDSLAETYPHDVSSLITKGDILREQEKFNEASAAYSVAIDRSTIGRDDWPLFYARGICYERAGQWNAAEKDFLKALSLKPNEPEVLNYLAYSWLTMNKNIQKAKEMLIVAVDARPEDAHIVDSLGWAHYLSGDFEKAVEILEQALNLMPDDPSINDHLGDAYWRAERKTEAQFQWQRALKNKPEKDLKKALERKLRSGLSPFMPQQQSLKLPLPARI